MHSSPFALSPVLVHISGSSCCALVSCPPARLLFLRAFIICPLAVSVVSSIVLHLISFSSSRHPSPPPSIHPYYPPTSPCPYPNPHTPPPPTVVYLPPPPLIRPSSRICFLVEVKSVRPAAALHKTPHRCWCVLVFILVLPFSPHPLLVCCWVVW